MGGESSRPDNGEDRCLLMMVPNDVLLMIASYSDVKDVLHTRLTCSRWGNIESGKWTWVANQVKMYKDSQPLVRMDKVKGFFCMAGGWITAISFATTIIGSAAILPMPVVVPMWVFFETNDDAKMAIVTGFLKSYALHSSGLNLWETEHEERTAADFIRDADIQYPIIHQQKLTDMSLSELEATERYLAEHIQSPEISEQPALVAIYREMRARVKLQAAAYVEVEE